MLEGKVGDFSLPEIFQLIALTKKTGTLSIATGTSQGRVRFRDGEVSEAASDVRRLALGARLVAAGLVDESQLAAALEAKRDHGGEVLRLLLEHAAIDDGALHAFVREQIADAVADMLRLEDASFRFDSDTPPEPLIDVQVATDQLVTEGNQRLAEWDAIRGHVPSSDTVFAVAPAPAADAGEITVGSDDWQVLALVDGRRPVREIVELSGRSEFGTSKALSRLAARGLVEACGGGGDGHPLSSLLARREVLRRLEELELSEIRPGPPQPAPDTEHSDPEPAEQDEVTTPQDGVPPPAATDRDGAGGGDLDGGDDTVPPAPSFSGPGAPTALGEPPHDQEATRGEATVPDIPVTLGGPSALPAGEPSPSGGEAGAPAPAANIDRAQVARELAALGLDGFAAAAPAHTRPPAEDDQDQAAGDAAEQGPAARRLARDEEFNKGLLLRLIDGVKGA